MPLVDHVEHRLADQVIADREDLQVVAVQQIALRGAVPVVVQGLVDLEVIAPASQLDAVVAKLAGLARHVLERQIGPLASEQGDGTCHAVLLNLVVMCCFRARPWRRLPRARMLPLTVCLRYFARFCGDSNKPGCMGTGNNLRGIAHRPGRLPIAASVMAVPAGSAEMALSADRERGYASPLIFATFDEANS